MMIPNFFRDKMKYAILARNILRTFLLTQSLHIFYNEITAFIWYFGGMILKLNLLKESEENHAFY
jgi:hypothetical protein